MYTFLTDKGILLSVTGVAEGRKKGGLSGPDRPFSAKNNNFPGGDEVLIL